MLRSVIRDHVILSGTNRSHATFSYQGSSVASRHKRIKSFFCLPDKDHMLRSAIRDHSLVPKDHMLLSVIKDHALLSGTRGSRATLATKRSRAQLLYVQYSTLLKVEKRGERTFSSRFGAGLRRFP